MSETQATSSPVINVTAQNFERDVIERSLSVPVVIDFWATWCGPCRMLGPVLEKLASEYNGKFVLAKIDTDTESELALQFGVRSIPAVFAVRDGKAIDGFIGVQPESMIRTWIDGMLPTPAETLTADARQVEQSDPRSAEEKYKAALALEPELSTAQIGLARIAMEQGRLDDARSGILELERAGILSPRPRRSRPS